MTAEALYMQHLQQLAAHLVAWLAGNPAEAFATASGLAGAFVLARNGRWAAYGWVAFLASNAAWIWFAARNGHAGMLVQQLGFTCSSLLGVWRWLLRPRLAGAPGKPQ